MDSIKAAVFENPRVTTGVAGATSLLVVYLAYRRLTNKYVNISHLSDICHFPPVQSEQFGRMFVSIYVCGYVCMYVFSILATPFNLQLRNFGITFLIWLSKNDFHNFLKKNVFLELLPFFYISLRFLYKFEERLR